MQWMYTASAVCAQTHAGRIAVTVSIDKVSFKNPARVGDIINIKAKMTRAFNKSMEIFVQAWSRKIISGEIHLINEAYFTFVALDENAKTTTVPKIKPSNTEERIQYKQALSRKLQ